MENKRFASVFGEAWCLMVGIFGILVAAVGMIAQLLSILGVSSSSIMISFTYTTPGFSKVISIFNILCDVPILLIGIGAILLYSNGKKGILNTTGIGMVKVCVMIRGIIAFVVGVIFSLLLLLGITIFSSSLDFLRDSVGESLGGAFIIIMLLITAVLIFVTVMSLIFTLRLNKVLGKTVEAYQTGNYNHNKTVTFGGIVLLVYIAIRIVLSVIYMLPKNSIIQAAFDSMGNTFIGDILAFVSEIGMFALVLIAILFACRMRKMSSVKSSSVNYIDNQNQVAATVVEDKHEPQITPEPEQATVQLDVTPEPPVDIPSKVDVKVFEGKITSLSGMDKGATYTIKAGEEIIIGKDPNTANIIVDKKYEKISRRHCGIKYDAENDIYMVIDYSMNGTYINSVKQLSKNIYVKVPKGTIINLAKENIDYKLC